MPWSLSLRCTSSHCTVVPKKPSQGSEALLLLLLRHAIAASSPLSFFPPLQQRGKTSTNVRTGCGGGGRGLQTALPCFLLPLLAPKRGRNDSLSLPPPQRWESASRSLCVHGMAAAEGYSLSTLILLQSRLLVRSQLLCPTFAPPRIWAGACCKKVDKKRPFFLSFPLFVGGFFAPTLTYTS